MDDLHEQLADEYRLSLRVVRELCQAAAASLKQRYLQQASRRRTRGGLLSWARRYLPHYLRHRPSGMHRWLEEQLAAMQQQRGMKLNVVGPRGGAKSTIGSLAAPLRAAVEASEPYVWIVSDTAQQAAAHLENIKAELIENKRLRRDYPQATGAGPIWRNSALLLNNGVKIEAFGSGQRIRGRRRREHRPTLIVCDDLQNDEHIGSALQRERTRRWFHGTLMKAGTPRTNVVNLATALHRDALAMELHRTPGWKSRVFAAIARWPDEMGLWEQWEAIYADLQREDALQQARRYYDTHRAQMEAGAELLWPDVEDLYTLMCMRVEGGRTAFQREKQGVPLNPELCEWPEAYFHEPLWFERWPARQRLRTVALDPSKGTDARRGDYSAIVMLAIDEEGTLCVEADLARRPTPQMVADTVECCRRFAPQALGIEANQFQDLLAADVLAELRRQGLLDLNPWLLENRVNKLVRIRRLGPYLAQRRLRFKAGSAGTRLLVDQLKDFPVGDYDDGPDALEMALRLAGQLLSGSGPADSLGSRLIR